MIKILALFCLLTSSVYAYIPPASFVLTKTAEKHGSGAYTIVQNVTFFDGSNKMNYKETWFVENDNNMRLLVTGPYGYKFKYEYKNGLRITPKGSRKLTDNFTEKYLNIRTHDGFVRALDALRVTNPDSHVHLSRCLGVSCYSISNQVNNILQPGVWIEQDQFLLRKVRFLDGSLFQAESYNQYGKNFEYPKFQIVQWGGNRVQIETTNVKNAVKMADWEGATSAQNELIELGPLKNQIEEFYERYR